MQDKSRVSASDRELLAELGSRLRELRRARGTTILDTAAATGLDRGTVARAEAGDNPTLLTILKLLRAYGRLGALDAFIPPPEVSPMRRLRERRRDADG